MHNDSLLCFGFSFHSSPTLFWDCFSAESCSVLLWLLSVVGKRRWERFLFRRKIRSEKTFWIVFHYPNLFSCFNHKRSAVNLFDFFLPVNFHINLFFLPFCHSNLSLAHWGVVWVRGKWVMQIFKISLMLSIYFPTFFSPPVLLSVFFLFILIVTNCFSYPLFSCPSFIPFNYVDNLLVTR